MIFKKIDEGYLDDRNNIVWQKAQPKKEFHYEKAIEYCKKLGDGWRLPTIKEMTSIINYNKYNPATDLPNMKSSFYWSSTTYPVNTAYAWIVNFNNGKVDSGYKYYVSNVRAVKDYSDSVVKKRRIEIEI